MDEEVRATRVLPDAVSLWGESELEGVMADRSSRLISPPIWDPRLAPSSVDFPVETQVRWVAMQDMVRCYLGVRREWRFRTGAIPTRKPILSWMHLPIQML